MDLEGFQNSVPSGGYRVQIATIIHPAAFWVVDPTGPDSSRAKVLDLEKKLAKAVRSNERITTDVNNRVAIKNPNTGAWHRGIVNNIVQIGDKYIYIVFLLDHGTCLQVEIDSLAELSKNFLRFTFQAFEVVLDGIEPNIQDDGKKRTKWPEAALVYVSQLLDTILYTYVVPAGVVENKIYGEIYLQCGQECKVLSALLCSNGYAKKCSSVFKSEVENGAKYLAKSTENVANGVEVDDGYISNYYIRNDKKNLKTSKKLKRDFAELNLKEPEFESVPKTKAVVTKNVQLESLKSTPSKSGYLLQSMEELIKNDNFFVSHSPFNVQPQNINLRPASDTRCARDKNAAAMYKGSIHRCGKTEGKCSRRNPSNESSSVAIDVGSKAVICAQSNVSTFGQSNVGIRGQSADSSSQGIDGHANVSINVKSSADSSYKYFDYKELTRQLSSKNVEGELINDDVLDGQSNCNMSSEQVTIYKITDALRSRFDMYELRESLDMTRVLVHGHVPLEPLDNMKDACFPTQIHRALEKLNFKSAFNIQLYAWASILEGRNTFMVGPAHSGKTLAYVLPLLSKCVSGTAFQGVKPGSAPNILVLCPGYETARFVYYVCSKILQLAGICHVDIILTHGGGAETELMTQLINGCDILISTPRCWLRLYQRSELLTNISRLCYIVLEDADVLISTFPEVKQIVQLCKKVSSVQCREILTICVSETWTKYIRGLAAGFTENACVCFGSCLEAAVYANLQPNLHFIAAEDKDKKVIRILSASYCLQRTVVVCLTKEQVQRLVGVLEEANIRVLEAHEDMQNFHLDEVRSRWLQSRRGNFPVLVCSDDVLLEMKVTDATTLIHYNLPTSSKTQFGFRFSCLMSNFRSIFSSADIMNLDCTVHVMVESSDIQQFPTLIDLVKRLGGVLPPEVMAKYAEVMDMREKQKISRPFCHSLKLFGSCSNMQKCPNRHFFSKCLDQTADLPHDGQVKMKVVHVHSANCFSVRLLEHRSNAGTNILVSNQYLDVTFKLEQFFSDLENRVQVADPTEGKMYAVSSNGYHRVICEKVEKNDVVVKFIDGGAVKTCKAYDLMPLSEELESIPAQVVEVVICEVAPHDNDTAWSMLATQAAFDWVSEMADNEDVDIYLAGKVVLSLGRTLWLSPVMGRQYLPDINTDIFVSSLKRDLIQGGYAVPNPGHIGVLYELCREAGISLAFPATAAVDDGGNEDSEQCISQQETIQTVGECQQQNEIQFDTAVVVDTRKREDSQEASVLKQLPAWESLSNDVCEVELSLVSPGELYVQKKENSEKIEELTDELQEYIANHRETVTAQPGIFCLGKWPDDNRWYRAKVIQLFEDDRLELFSVDLGDFTTVSSKDIAVLPHTYMTKLPFQAVECELASVKPCHGDVWEESVNEGFYNLLNEEFNWSVEVLSSSEASTTGGLKYIVKLQGVNEYGCIDVNQELLNLGLASITDSECDDDFEFAFTEEEIYNLLHKKSDSASSPVSESNKIIELEAPKESSQSTCSNEVMPPLASYAKTPQLRWYQTAHLVCFEIQVPGVETYSVRCTRTQLQFRAAVSGDVYYVSLLLCGIIEPQESLHAEIVGGVRVKLRKQTTGFKWPYLVIPVKDVIKANWSLDHIDVPGETDERFTGFLSRECKSDESDKERELLSESDESGDESTPFS